MTESGYYPPGADTEDAPWNQVDNPEREIEVTVSVTLSKTVKIKVSDYEITEEQIVLPQKAWDYIAPKSKKDVKAIFDLKDWNVDDFEIVKE